jgi:hypothetical protein
LAAPNYPNQNQMSLEISVNVWPTGLSTSGSAKIERMIRDGEIKDATTVAALGLLRLKGLL